MSKYFYFLMWSENMIFFSFLRWKISEKRIFLYQGWKVIGCRVKFVFCQIIYFKIFVKFVFSVNYSSSKAQMNTEKRYKQLSIQGKSTCSQKDYNYWNNRFESWRGASKLWWIDSVEQELWTMNNSSQKFL